jgi:hypothetical protein
MGAFVKKAYSFSVFPKLCFAPEVKLRERKDERAGAGAPHLMLLDGDLRSP